MTTDETTNVEIEVRDNRNGGYLWMDNEILEVYGPAIGPYGIALYAALAMHANDKREDGQIVWPAYETMADMTGMDRRSAIRAMKALQAVGLVYIPKREKDAPRTSNHVTLLPIEKLPRGPARKPARRAARQKVAAMVAGDSQSLASDSQSPADDLLVTGSHQPSDSQSPEQSVRNKPAGDEKTPPTTPPPEGAAAPRAAVPAPAAKSAPDPASQTATPVVGVGVGAESVAESEAVKATLAKLAEHGLSQSGPVIALARDIAGKPNVDKVVDALAEQAKRQAKTNPAGLLITLLKSHDWNAGIPTPPRPARHATGNRLPQAESTPAQAERSRQEAATRLEVRHADPAHVAKLQARLENCRAELAKAATDGKRDYWRDYIQHTERELAEVTA
jgi:hypothetical protein